MNSSIKYNLFLIDILDFYYYVYSDILINKAKYKNIKGISPVVCYTIILKFIKNLEVNNSLPNSKIFFYIKEPNVKYLELRRLKDSTSKREKNIDHHFEFFFNIFISLLKNINNNYYIIYNNTNLIDSIMSINKDKNVVFITRKMDKCSYLTMGENIYWYNHNHFFNIDSFLEYYKFLPTEDKINLYNILSKKPKYRTKLYKNFNLSNDTCNFLTNKFDSFSELRENYMQVLSEDIKKKIYSSMKILLINKQSIGNSDYSVFDIDESQIYQSKLNPVMLNIWKKLLRIDLL